MENQRQTLGSVISQPGKQTEGQQDAPSFNTYLTVLSINLAHRFDVTDINSIDLDQVRRVAEFSVVCSNIAVETWNTLNSVQSQRVLSRQSRAA